VASVRGSGCPTPVAVDGAPDILIVTPSSRGQKRRHRSGAAGPVLTAAADPG